VNHGTNIGRGARRLVAILAVGLIAGCSGGEPSPTGTPAGGPSGASAAGEAPRLLFISNGNSDWWNAVEKGMLDGGKEFGAKVELRRNNEAKTEGQIRLLEDALSLPDVKGVAISVLEAESPGIADKMRELQKAGKVVIAIDSDSASADTRRAYIGTNNRLAGEFAGKAAAAIRPQGGRTAVFVGTAAAANAIERREGFFQGAGPKFQEPRPEVFEDNVDVSGRARSNVQTAISKYPDLGVLLGLWSYNAPAIGEEVNKSPEIRKKVSVVTFDLDELAVEQIEKGWIDVTVCQNPYEMGYRGVRLLKAIITSDKATVDAMLPGGATTIDTGVRVIVKSKDSPVKGENVIDIKAMKEWLASKGLKAS
jgi:ribose transport system substrate-binding protein